MENNEVMAESEVMTNDAAEILASTEIGEEKKGGLFKVLLGVGCTAIGAVGGFVGGTIFNKGNKDKEVIKSLNERIEVLEAAMLSNAEKKEDVEETNENEEEKTEE